MTCWSRTWRYPCPSFFHELIQRSGHCLYIMTLDPQEKDSGLQRTPQTGNSQATHLCASCAGAPASQYRLRVLTIASGVCGFAPVSSVNFDSLQQADSAERSGEMCSFCFLLPCPQGTEMPSLERTGSLASVELPLKERVWEKEIASDL